MIELTFGFLIIGILSVIITSLVIKIENEMSDMSRIIDVLHAKFEENKGEL